MTKKKEAKPIIINPLDASILFFIATCPEGTKEKYRTLQPLIENDHVKKLCRAIWGFKSTIYFQKLAKDQLAWAKKYTRECASFYSRPRNPSNFPRHEVMSD